MRSGRLMTDGQTNRLSNRLPFKHETLKTNTTGTRVDSEESFHYDRSLQSAGNQWK